LDQYATPINWTITSRFIYENRLLEIPSTDLGKTGRINDGTIVIDARGKKRSQSLSTRITSNWSLFEAVQRLPVIYDTPLEFAYLEDLSLIKRRHKLSYQGSHVSVWQKDKQHIHCFQHTGAGIVPIEYWLNRHHELFLVVTGPRAYILDEHAEHMFNDSHPTLVERI
jgi:hypothetical protein